MNFFIGQRVRVVADLSGEFPHFIGTEGHITEMDSDFQSGVMYGLNFFPIRQISVVEWVGFDPEELEPILPSGAQPSEFTTLHDLLTSLEGVCV